VSNIFNKFSKRTQEQRELRNHSNIHENIEDMKDNHQDMKDKHIGTVCLLFGIITLLVSISGGCALRDMTTAKASRFKVWSYM